MPQAPSWSAPPQDSCRGCSPGRLLLAVAILGAVPPVGAQRESGQARAPGVAGAYPAAARFFAQHAAPLTLLSVTARRPLGRGDTLLLVRAAMPDSVRSGLGESGYPGKELLTAYGAFVVRGGRVRLALGPEEAVRGDARLSWGADDMRVEAASAHAVTLGLYGDTYGVLDRKVTYLLDLGTPAVLGRIVHRGLIVGAIAPFRDSLYATVSPDGKTSTLVIIARQAPGEAVRGAVAGPPAIGTLDQVGGAPLPVVHAALARGDSLTLYGDSVALVRTARGWSHRLLPPRIRVVRLPSGDSLDLTFLPNPLSAGAVATRLLPHTGDAGDAAAFLVTGAEVNKSGRQVQYAGVYQLAPERHRLHPLPVPTYARFARMRPERVRDGYSSEFTELEAAVGAFQVVRDTVWFGTNFYDGEGTTGVGAVGSFALATRRYDVRYSPALADWSTSALAADGGALWLGLVVYPEGAPQSGGVLRYDRRTGAARRYALPEVVNALVPWGGTVYAGTVDGVYRLQDGRFVPLPLGFDPRGRVVSVGARRPRCGRPRAAQRRSSLTDVAGATASHPPGTWYPGSSRP